MKGMVYIAIERRKDVLDMCIGQNESAKFWLSILNDLKNCGAEDILSICVDGLVDFPRPLLTVMCFGAALCRAARNFFMAACNTWFVRFTVSIANAMVLRSASSCNCFPPLEVQ